MPVLLLLILLLAAPLAVAGQSHIPDGMRLEPFSSLDPATSCQTTLRARGNTKSNAVHWWRDAATAPALGSWCAAVGGAVVEPEPEAYAVEAEEGIDSLAIVSWNTHVGAGDLERLVADLRAGRLTEGRPVQHFVLLLQEAPRAGTPVPETLPAGAKAGRAFHDQPDSPERFDIVEMAQRLGLALYYVPSMRNGLRQEDWGNALLSTLPLSGFEAIELPFESRRRVAATALVEGRTRAGWPWRLRLSSAHLDVWSRRGLGATVGSGRLRQSRTLVSALGQDSTPTVLGGDFNTWSPREHALPYLREHFPDTPPGERRHTHRTTRRQLDHLFFRLPDCWTARYRRTDERYGSDHYLLLGWVSIGACSAPPLPRAGYLLPTFR